MWGWDRGQRPQNWSMLIRHSTELRRGASGAFFMPIAHPSLPQAKASKQADTHPKGLGREMKESLIFFNWFSVPLDALRIAWNPRWDPRLSSFALAGEIFVHTSPGSPTDESEAVLVLQQLGLHRALILKRAQSPCKLSGLPCVLGQACGLVAFLNISSKTSYQASGWLKFSNNFWGIINANSDSILYFTIYIPLFAVSLRG